MSKQDRQAARTVADLARRLGGEKSPSGDFSELELEMQELNRYFQQFATNVNSKLVNKADLDKSGKLSQEQIPSDVVTEEKMATAVNTAIRKEKP